MTDLGNEFDTMLAWDGSDPAAPDDWIRENARLVLIEAADLNGGPISDSLDRLIQIAQSNQDAASWGLAGLFATVKEAAGAVVYKFFSFVGSGVSRAKNTIGVSLWNAFSALFQRYAPKLREIAKHLKATGFSLGINIPIGFSFALNFDF